MCLVDNDRSLFLTSVEVMYLYNLLSIIMALVFSALMLLVRQQEGHLACKKTEWWDAGTGIIICLGRGANLLMAQLMPLPLTVCCSSKSRLVLLFWFYLFGTSSPR